MSGSIPSEIWNLVSIKWFYLFNNKFTGSIPEGFGNLHQLNRVFLHNNLLTGTLPDVFTYTMLQWLDISNNEFSGPIPNSLWNLTSFERLRLRRNDLTGTVPRDFCSANANMENFEVDLTSWFLDEPKVTCPCCGIRQSCYLYNIEQLIVGDRARVACPSSNIVNIPNIYSEYWATDLLSNTTLSELFGLIFDEANLCLSPTGCYNIEHFDDELQKTKTSYSLSYSSSSKFLVRQDECEAVEICGTSFDSNHPRRSLLNHLTQNVVPNFAELNDPLSPQSQALCWIMVEDSLFDDYEICDGSLLQRYVFAFFFISQQNSKYDFNSFSSEPTCEWPGIICDMKGKFVEHINLPNAELHGTIITEIGFLSTLKTIDLSSNSLTGDLIIEIGALLDLQTINFTANQLKGTISPSMLINLQKLQVFDVSQNQLGGNVPKELLELPVLRRVNLMDNSLIGTLPTVSYSNNLGKFLYHHLSSKERF